MTPRALTVTVPLVTVISLSTKLVVLSLKVAVTANGALTVAAVAELRLTVGAKASMVKLLLAVGVPVFVPLSKVILLKLGAAKLMVSALVGDAAISVVTNR